MSTNLNDAELEDLISQAEAARLRGVSRQAISNLIAKGKITQYKVADKVLVSKKEILAFEPETAGRPSKGPKPE